MDYAVIALVMASLIGLLEVISILVVRHEVATARKFYEGRSYGEDFVQELDKYLMFQPEGEELTRLEAIGTVIGNRLYEATRYAGMQVKSVDARVQNRMDADVKKAIQDKMPVRFKVIKRVAEELGFDFDDILAANEVVPFMKSLRKHGAGGLLTERESSSSW